MKRNLYLSVIVILFSANIVFAQKDTTTTDVKTSEGIDSIKNNKFKLYPGFGISLIRNEFAPAFYINIGINHKDIYEVNINSASFFFFDREPNSKNYNIYRNTFVNLEFLLNFSPLSKSIKNWNGIGAGYLVENKGQYFRDPTFFIYYKRKLPYISILPGIMLADGGKDVFPMISIKL
jgi:hypothetical protein